MRADLEENWSLFRSKLEPVKETANGIEACCPAHDDNHASLTASCNGQKILVKCHAGCSFTAIISALGMQTRQFFDSNQVQIPTKKEVGRYG